MNMQHSQYIHLSSARCRWRMHPSRTAAYACSRTIQRDACVQAAAHRYGWLPRCRDQLLLRSQKCHADQRLLRQTTPAVQPRTTGSIKTIHVCLQAAEA
jgi:hypothetical protein